MVRLICLPGCQCIQQGPVLQHLLDQRFRPGLAIHIGHQIGQLRPRIQQLAQRLNLRRNRRRGEILHALEGDIDSQIAIPRQRIGHRKRSPRLHRLHPRVKIIDVNLKEFAVRNARLRGFGFPRKVRHHPHHKGKLNLLFRSIQLHIIFDLDPRRTVARDEFLRPTSHSCYPTTPLFPPSNR